MMGTPIDWPVRERKFLAELSATGNVSRACLSVGISRQSAYARKCEDGMFADAWEDALETATDALELEARRRALEGCKRPVFQGGSQVGTIREYSDTLMIFLLKAHRPRKFRDNVQHSHDGGLTIRVEYADNHDLSATPSPGPGDDPA
jgi:hypothetical protein